MSSNKQTKSHVSNQPNNNQPSNVNPRASRAKSADSSRLSRDQKKDMARAVVESRSLEETGHQFNTHGKLVQIADGQPFQFFVYRNNDDNQRRYHAIGRLVDQYVYGLLEAELKLQRLLIPMQPKNSEPTSFFFASEDARNAEYLMIIIHGMGVVRAGQWSRRLIMNENLMVGSQFDYIRRARHQGYGVIVTNTNLNVDEFSTSNLHAPRRVRGSSSPEEHGCYIWDKFIRSCRAPHICIVAHSYGGAVMLALAKSFTPEFDKRVFAVALTDSPMKAYIKHASSSISKILKPRTINWIADNKAVDTPAGTREYGELRSAGHALHEWTSYTAFESIFKFFGEQRSRIERSKRS